MALKTQLSSGQKTTFLNWITANANGQTDLFVANLANTVASPSYFIWLANGSKAILDALIVKADYTPSDAIPTNASPATLDDVAAQLLFMNRCNVSMLKQLNAQWMVTGAAASSFDDARLASVRQNLQDCLTSIPMGTSGANLNAGWGSPTTPGVFRLACMRTVTNFEKLYVAVAQAGPGNNGDPRGNNTNPDVLGIGAGPVGGAEISSPITEQDVSDIRGGL